MSNEEAIKEIEKWLDGCPFAYTKAAFGLAINALLKEIVKEEAAKEEGPEGDVE